MTNGNFKISEPQSNQDANELAQQFQAGLQKTQKLLASTIVTSKRQGVEITLTAEPKILNVLLPPDVDVKTLETILRDCLNDAFAESMKAVFENTTKELTQSSR